MKDGNPNFQHMIMVSKISTAPGTPPGHPYPLPTFSTPKAKISGRLDLTPVKGMTRILRLLTEHVLRFDPTCGLLPSIPNYQSEQTQPINWMWSR